MTSRRGPRWLGFAAVGVAAVVAAGVLAIVEPWESRAGGSGDVSGAADLGAADPGSDPAAALAAGDPASAASPAASVSASWQRTVTTEDGLASRVGVRVTQVALTGGGGLLDLRVLVLDAERAAALHDVAAPPAVVDEATGVVASDLLMGHSHTSPFQAGVTYYFVFENPGNVIQRGGSVSVLLGSVELDHVEVR